MHIHSRAQWDWHVVDNHPDRDGEAGRREAFDTTNWWSSDRKRFVVQSALSGNAAGSMQVKPFKSCQLVPNDALLTLHICFWLCLICTITEPWCHNYHHFVYLIKSHSNNESRETETLILRGIKGSICKSTTERKESRGNELWACVSDSQIHWGTFD